MYSDTTRRGATRPAMLICLLLSLTLLAGAAVSCKPRTPAEVPTEAAGSATEVTDATDAIGTTDTPVTLPDETVEGFTQAPDTAPAPTVSTDPLAPVFSAESGLYTSTLSLTLSLPADAPDGTVIRYTTDGSVPTRKSDAYRSALSLLRTDGSAASVRAACFDSIGNRISAVVTGQYVRAAASDLWTVMISVAGKDLDEITSNIQKKIEKPVHVSVVTPDGKTVISQDAGIRLFGGSSRSLPQKSFKLIARKDGYFGEKAAYTGKGSFAYPLFGDRVVKAGPDAGKVLDKFDSFILRNGGNDSLLASSCDPADATLLRDGVVNNWAMTVAPHVDNSLSQFAAVYINGKYYGILDMRENLNEDYVKRVWGVDDNDVVVVKSELDTTRKCSQHKNGGSCRFDNVWFFYETDDTDTAQAALKEWTTLCRDAIKALTADEAAYAAMFETVSDRVDLVSFKEYMALNLYLCNTDWPHNNVKLWKYTGAAVDGIAITDGKWRFMTRDMDMAMSRYSTPGLLPELNNVASTDTFWRCLGNYVDGYRGVFSNSGETQLYPDSLYLQGLLAFCLRNDGFRADFEAYARGLAAAEAAETLKGCYTPAYNAVRAGIEAYIDRWDGDGIQVDKRGWDKSCKRITTFIKDRPAKFLQHLDRLMGMYKETLI